MSVTRIQPQPFFADKNRAFWNLQSLGWAGAFLLRGSSTIANGQSFSSLIPVLISTVTGYSVTLLIAVAFRYLLKQRPIVTWGVSILTVVLAAALVAFIDAWVFSTQNRSGDTAGVQLFLGAFYLSVTLIGAWSALYYAINFYLTVEEQADQLTRLETQASSAQLAMLRYQLNPHFLFNTLNTISALTRTEPDRAREVLLKLSNILRGRLKSQVNLIPLRQELDFLNDYLDIEVVRFGKKKLRIYKNIEPETLPLVVPNMLLQPLVENALRHGIAPKIEGGILQIDAYQKQGRLHLRVKDNGVGIPPERQKIIFNSGIGISNVLERLKVIYGEEFRFDVKSEPSRGTEIFIEIPELNSLPGAQPAEVVAS